MAARRRAEPDVLAFLYAHRQILAGDYRTGNRFAFLSRHRGEEPYRERFRAAQAVLEEAGDNARAMVELVAVRRRLPGSRRGLASCLTGLDVLNDHFRQTGQLSERS